MERDTFSNHLRQFSSGHRALCFTKVNIGRLAPKIGDAPSALSATVLRPHPWNTCCPTLTLWAVALPGVVLARCVPSLEHQHVPKEVLPIARAGLMLGPFFARSACGRVAPAPFIADELSKIARPFLERTPQPLIDGNAKPHFRPFQ